MGLPDFPAPSPAPIEKVSPSLANQLHSCRLKVAFSRDPVYKTWRRPSTYSALGLVAHGVTEAAYKHGGFGDDAADARAWLEETWDSLLAKEVGALAAAWSPAQPPAAGEWPGYQLTRARTLRRAERLLKASAKQEVAARAKGTGLEIDLEDPVSGLYGRADRIERHGSSTRIVDLKTGLRQAEPSEEQQRQLLLYAVLVHRTSGEWPAEIAIEDASGKQTSIAFEPKVAEAALEEALAVVDAFNGRSGNDLIATAEPSADRCRWCEYRVTCGPYWAALQTDWGHRAVMGSIASRGESPQGAFTKVLADSPSDLAGRQVHVSSLPSPPRSEASWIAVVDGTSSPESGDLRARWSTRARSW